MKEADATVDEAAAGWVARLSSADATDRDRAEFEAWRAADPAHAAAYAEMEALWRELGRVPDPRTRRRRPKGGLAVAAAALTAALAYQAGLVDRVRADHWSGVGEVAHAVLPDGSRVDLNTDTALALRFTPGERGVALLRGEALFDVAPDPARPFVVRGGDLTVRALGTRFFVRVDGAPELVGVSEGRVEVAAPGRSARLSGGEAIRRPDEASLAVARVDVDRATAWRRERLVVSGEKLSAVLAALGRHRHGRIVLLDPAAGERLVTGVFDLADTDGALDALAVSLGVRVTRLTPLLVLVGSPL